MAIEYEDIAKEFEYPTYDNPSIDLSSFADLSEQVGSDQQSQMDWIDQYFYSPESVQSLSEHINTLLDPYGSYIQEARTEAEKGAEEQGYLTSGMSAGSAEASAIDKVYNIAYGNLKGEMYNAYTSNHKKYLEYITARDAAMSSFNQEYELGSKDVFADIYDQFKERQQRYKLEQQEHMAMYESYQDFNRASYNLDITQYAATEEQLRQQLKDKAGLLAHYMDAFNQVVTSDVNEEDKFTRLNALITEAEDLMDTEQLGVTGSPYQIEDIYGRDALVRPDISEEIFTWDINDATYEWGKLKEIVDDIYFKIHEATSNEERNHYGPYENLQYVQSSMEALKTVNPEAFSDILQWYDRQGKSVIEDDWETTIRTMKDLMRGAFLSAGRDYRELWSIVEVIDPDNELYRYQTSAPRWDTTSQSIVYDVYEKGQWGAIQLVHSGMAETGIDEWQINWDNIRELGGQAKTYILDNYQQTDYQHIIDYMDVNNYPSSSGIDKTNIDDVVNILATDLLIHLEPERFWSYLPNLPYYHMVQVPYKGEQLIAERFVSYPVEDGVVKPEWSVGVEINGNKIILTEDQALDAIYRDCINSGAGEACQRYDSLDRYRN